MIIRNKQFLGFLCAIGISLLAIRPLFVQGYFPMHDDTQVARVIVMARALRQGQFPVRWVSDLGYGYGYPLYNYYGPLPYYIGGILNAFGVDSVIATKIMFGIGVILAPIFMYLLLGSVFGTTAGIVGSVLFSFAPYRAVDIYIRGAVGEYWAIAFMPLILWGIIETFRKSHMKGVLAGGIGLSAVILSHTILGYITTGLFTVGIFLFWIIEIVTRRMSKKILFLPFSIFFIGLGISAFFWIPAFAEMGLTGVGTMITHASTNFYDHFVCFGQLWNSPWGFGGSAPGCIDGMSFKLGKIQLVCAVTGIIMWVFQREKKKTERASVVIYIAITLFTISLFGVLRVSEAIWRIIPYASFIQYPWRLLSYTIVSMGICAAAGIKVIKKRGIRITVSILSILVCLWVNIKLFKPQYFYKRASGEFGTQEELRYRVSKVSDEYLPTGIIKPQIPTDIVHEPIDQSSTVHVRMIRNNDTFMQAEVVSQKNQSITIQKAYFPGWTIRVNGSIIKPSIATGLPSVILSEGTSIIEMKLSDTPVRMFANLISLASIVAVIWLYAYGGKTIS
jgi:hypothetical protein